MTINTNVYKTVFFVAGVLTLGYLLYSIGWDLIWLNLTKTGFWFIPVVGSWLLIYILNALAFTAIIEEPQLPNSKLPFLTVLRIIITGYAINYITPFVALGGEPYRILELKPALGTSKATSSVLLYNLMHMFSHVLFWLASIGLIVAVLPLATPVLLGCGALLVCGLFLGYWFTRAYKNGFTVSTFRLLEKIPFVKNKARAFASEKSELLYDIDDQIRVLYADRKPRFYSSLLLEFVARVIGCAEIYFTARSIGLGMSLGDSLIVSSGSSLIANLIFFLPMQLGSREGGLALALRWVGFPATSGLFIGIVMRIRELVWIVIGLTLLRISKPATAKKTALVPND